MSDLEGTAQKRPRLNLATSWPDCTPDILSSFLSPLLSTPLFSSLLFYHRYLFFLSLLLFYSLSLCLSFSRDDNAREKCLDCQFFFYNLTPSHIFLVSFQFLRKIYFFAKFFILSNVIIYPLSNPTTYLLPSTIFTDLFFTENCSSHWSCYFNLRRYF